MIDFTPGVYGNDTLPDCTAVALANAARGVAYVAGYPLVVYQTRVPAFYGQCIGQPDATKLAATDGAVMLDVLQRQASHGFDVGPQSLCGRFGTVPISRTALALSMARLCAGYWGIQLRDRDMQTFGSGVWDVQDGRDDGDGVGGHAVMAWAYTGLADDARVQIATWGQWQPATWAWVKCRLDEAYGLVWRQLERTDGTFYAGLTADDLVGDL